MESNLGKGSDLYEQLEQQGTSKEGIWQIFQNFELDEISRFDTETIDLSNENEGIAKFFDKDALVGKAHLMIDTQEGIDWEGGLKNAFVEEVSNFIKRIYPKTGSLLRSGTLQWKQFFIGTERKKQDYDPFLNGGVNFLYFQNHRIAILFSERTETNHAEIDFIIYPKLIIRLLESMFPKGKNEENE